jgi:hypothetical protein
MLCKSTSKDLYSFTTSNLTFVNGWLFSNNFSLLLFILYIDLYLNGCVTLLVGTQVSSDRF